MPKIAIAGYLVLRLPEWNYDAARRGVYRDKPPRLNHLIYEGIDRMDWFDVDEDYYTGLLVEPFRNYRDRIRDENSDLAGVYVARDFKTAKSLLDYSNRKGLRNEIIAVRSTKLAELKGEVYVKDVQIEWIGYDVVELGFWSLLSEGVFVAPDYFPEWSTILNAHGLLSEFSKLTQITEAYANAARNGKVEELPPSVYGADPIEIGRVFYSLT